MNIVGKMLEASNETRRMLDPTGSMRMEAALKALLAATGLTEAQLEGLANGEMVVVRRDLIEAVLASTGNLALDHFEKSEIRAVLAAKEG